MNTYSNELYHYGVLGMKWGVRKGREEYYNRRANISASKAKRSITRFGKKWHGDRAADFREMATTSKMMKKQRGIARLRTQFGYGRKSRIANARSEKYANRIGMARTRTGSDYAKARSKNLKETSKTYKKAHDQKNIIDKVTTSLSGRLFEQPYHRMNGKTTSSGREYVGRALLGSNPGTTTFYTAWKVGSYYLGRNKYGEDSRDKAWRKK